MTIPPGERRVPPQRGLVGPQLHVVMDGENCPSFFLASAVAVLAVPPKVESNLFDTVCDWWDTVTI